MNKNIFFLFPPGYSGNYLQWTINISEETKKHLTTKDPLLPDGTTHGFTRKPTHTGVYNILNWIIKNQPVDPQTFVVLVDDASDQWQCHSAHTAYRFLRSYPDALFVNIYAKTNDEAKVAALNGYTKWTTWIYDLSAFDLTKKLDFDWEGGKNNCISLEDRNWLLKNWTKVFHMNRQPFNWNELEHNISGFKRWYNQRKKIEPLDTNDTQYNTFETFSKDNIVDLSIGEIYDQHFTDNKFFTWIENHAVGNFDWTHVKQYHQTYLEAQENIKWFADINSMRNKQKVSKWLLKNSFSQALVLEEIESSLNQIDNWKEKSTEEILTNLGYTIL